MEESSSGTPSAARRKSVTLPGRGRLVVVLHSSSGPVRAAGAGGDGVRARARPYPPNTTPRSTEATAFEAARVVDVVYAQLEPIAKGGAM